MKTDKNENVNDHLKMLLFESNVKSNTIDLNETEGKGTFSMYIIFFIWMYYVNTV